MQQEAQKIAGEAKQKQKQFTQVEEEKRKREREPSTSFAGTSTSSDRNSAPPLWGPIGLNLSSFYSSESTPVASAKLSTPLRTSHGTHPLKPPTFVPPQGKSPSGSFNAGALPNGTSPEEWQRRKNEFTNDKQECFRREQEKMEADFQMRSAGKPLSRDDMAKVFENHERLWSQLSQKSSLTWNNFPWPMARPPATPDDISLAMISAYMHSQCWPDKEKPKTSKDRIKDHLKRWHPDRFETKHLIKVMEHEREKVKQGAGNVARYLSDLLRKENENISNRDLFGTDHDGPPPLNEIHRFNAQEWSIEEQARRKENEVRAKQEALRKEELGEARRREGWQARLRAEREAQVRLAEEKRRIEEEAERQAEEAKQKETEAKKKEQDMTKLEQDAKNRAADAKKLEEAKQKEAELKKKEEATRKLEEKLRQEAQKIAEQAKRLEEQTREHEREIKEREEALLSRELEAERREEQARRKEEDTKRLEEKHRKEVEVKWIELEAQRKVEVGRLLEQLWREDEARKERDELANTRELDLNAREKAVTARERRAEKIVENARRQLEQDVQTKMTEVTNLQHAVDEAKRKIVALEKNAEKQLIEATTILEAARQKETEVRNREEAVRKRDERLKQDLAKAKREAQRLTQEDTEKQDKLLQFEETLVTREKELKRREEMTRFPRSSSTLDGALMQHMTTGMPISPAPILSSSINLSDHGQYFQEYQQNTVSISSTLRRVPSAPRDMATPRPIDRARPPRFPSEFRVPQQTRLSDEGYYDSIYLHRSQQN